MIHYTIGRMTLIELIEARKIYKSSLIKNGGFFKSMLYAPDLTDYFRMIAIRHNGRIVGYIYPKTNRKLHRIEEVYGEHVYSEDNLYLSSIAIHKDYRGKGAAEELVNYVINKYNKKDVYLHIREGNVRSEQFSLKKGFRVVGIARVRGYNSYMYYKEIK